MAFVKSRACFFTGARLSVRPSTALRAEKQQSRGNFQRLNPPQAPPPGDAPPPPPPPLKTDKDEEPFPSRRDILLGLVVGSGLWWWKLRELEPDVGFRKTPGGIPYMVTPSGEIFAMFITKGRGKPKLVMMDSSGIMYYDTDDRDQGIYVVDRKNDVVNVYSTPSGDLAVERIGNLNNVEQLQISNIGNVRLERDRIVWAFVDEPEPLVVNPGAFALQSRPDGDVLLPPARIDEGVIRVKEAKKQLLGGLFSRNKDELGGKLERERL